MENSLKKNCVLTENTWNFLSLFPRPHTVTTVYTAFTLDQAPSVSIDVYSVQEGVGRWYATVHKTLEHVWTGCLRGSWDQELERQLYKCVYT